MNSVNPTHHFNINCKTFVIDPTLTGTCMLDKLEMTTEENLNFSLFNKIFEDYQVCIVPDTIYRNCYVIKKNSKEVITLKTNPIWKGVHQLKIIVNPSKWNSFEPLQNLLSKLCDIKLLEISRIDHAVDIPLSFEEFYAGLHIKHKRGQKIYKEDCSIKGKFLTGCTIGGKPELYTIYDKGYELFSKRLKRNRTLEEGIFTRIELRQFKTKIKYKSLLQLANYISDPPFHGIEYYIINSNNEKAKALAILMNLDGLQKIRAILNEKNNFERNYKKFLAPNDLQNIINCTYQEELRLFFGSC